MDIRMNPSELNALTGVQCPVTTVKIVTPKNTISRVAAIMRSIILLSSIELALE
jgi:hypothetical protein